MQKLFTLIVPILFSSMISKVQAQTDTDSEMTAYYEGLQCMTETRAAHLQAPKGTYQFFITEEDSTQLLRTDLAEKIESYRDENTVVHLKISSTTTIRILPCSEITSTRFVPVNKEVFFQQSSGYPSAKR